MEPQGPRGPRWGSGWLVDSRIQQRPKITKLEMEPVLLDSVVALAQRQVAVTNPQHLYRGVAKVNAWLGVALVSVLVPAT